MAEQLSEEEEEVDSFKLPLWTRHIKINRHFKRLCYDSNCNLCCAVCFHLDTQQEPKVSSPFMEKPMCYLTVRILLLPEDTRSEFFGTGL